MIVHDLQIDFLKNRDASKTTHKNKENTLVIWLQNSSTANEEPFRYVIYKAKKKNMQKENILYNFCKSQKTCMT